VTTREVNSERAKNEMDVMKGILAQSVSGNVIVVAVGSIAGRSAMAVIEVPPLPNELLHDRGWRTSGKAGKACTKNNPVNAGAKKYQSLSPFAYPRLLVKSQNSAFGALLASQGNLGAM
jgi:hypothetical protein